MSNNTETQPIPVRTLAEWGAVKRETAIEMAERAEEETTAMPVIIFHALEGQTEVPELPADHVTIRPRGITRVRSAVEVKPPAALSIETVGVEEKLGTKPQQAAHAQENHPGYIIWYGEATQEFWVMGEELVSYATYSHMIQGLTGTVSAIA